MRLIKISPKFQITIPKNLRYILKTNWVSAKIKDGAILITPVSIKTEVEELPDCLKEFTDEQWDKIWKH